jgi:putative tryptophan/tyrosine transport system substrate-binding protein
MTRRSGTLTAAIVIVACHLFAPSIAEAQQAGKTYRIGYLAPRTIFPAFRQEMRALGYIEGKNLTFEYRRANRNNQFLRFAKELSALKVDLILAVGADATRAAKQATSTVPIVMGNSSADPVRLGLIESLARPGGNITGVIDILPDLAGKQLELLKEIFPKLSRIAHLSPREGIVGSTHLKETKTAARTLGVSVQALTAGGPDDLEKMFEAVAKSGTEAIIVVGVGYFIPHRQRIVNLENKYRLPTMHTHAPWVQLGGLISYTTDGKLRHRRAAHYVDKILRGARPADLPVEQQTKFLLQINLKTARALGITVPRSIMLRADKIIE